MQTSKLRKGPLGAGFQSFFARVVVAGVLEWVEGYVNKPPPPPR